MAKGCQFPAFLLPTNDYTYSGLRVPIGGGSARSIHLGVTRLRFTTQKLSAVKVAAQRIVLIANNEQLL